MFKTSSLFLLILLCYYSVQAQNQTAIDSLLRIVETDSSNVGRVDTYVEIAMEYQSLDSSNTVSYATKAIQLAEKINYREGIIDANCTIAKVNIIVGNYTKAEKLFMKAIHESESIGYSRGEASGLLGVGLVNHTNSLDEKALDFYIKSLSFSEPLNEKNLMHTAYHYIGNIYINKVMYDKAHEYHQKALAISKETQDVKGIAIGYSNIGIIYDLQGNFDKAYDYYNCSLKIKSELGDSYGVAADYNNLGMLFKSQGNFKKALEYAFQALDKYKAIGNRVYLSYPILTIGEIYLAQGSWRKAKTYYDKGLKLSRETENKSNISLAAEGLATIESELGNFKKAYEYHVLFKQLDDGLTSKTQAEKLTKLEMDYKFQQQKDSLEFAATTERITLQNEIANKEIIQYSTLMGIILLGIIILVLLLFLKSKNRINKLLSKESIKLKIMNEETAKNLLFKNQKLSEYAHFNSHETRAPIASLLGLIQLIKTEDVDAETADLLKKMKECAFKLDETTIKMNKTLEEAGYFEGQKSNS